MLKNFFVVVVVSFTSFAWSAHLMSPKTCFPCIFATHHLRSKVDKSLDTIWALAESAELPSSLSNSLLDLELRQKEAAAVATARRLVRCRHARSVDAYDAQSKRKGAAADITLCHFKICNMGRKRSVRFIHSLHNMED